jgi:hypothetical protein
VNEGIYTPAGGETTSRFMSGWLKTGSASAIILLLTSAKNLLNLLNKFAHGELILLTENHKLPFIQLAI